MSVTIRLRRVGRKKQSSYRVVVMDSRSPRDGAYIDQVGFYNPKIEPAELRLDLDRVDAWLGKGAEMSDTVASLVRKVRKGGDESVLLRPMGAAPEAVAQPEGAEAAASAESAEPESE
jgi:small subunit ribosomal protein S16